MKKRKGGFNIQSIIMSVLMASTLITITIMGLLLYHRFKLAMDNTAVSNTEATVESSVDRLNSDLLDIRQIFNAANYNIIQEFDISSQEFAKQCSLLYETNSDKIQSMALYGSDGNLIASEPVSLEKENVEIKTRTGIRMRKMRLKIFIFPCLMYRTCSRTELIGIIESFRSVVRLILTTEIDRGAECFW